MTNPLRWVETQAQSARSARPSQHARHDVTEVDGWHIPYGPRPITVTSTDPKTGTVIGKENMHVGQILRLISNYLDHLEGQKPTDDRTIALALAVYELVVSDLETGTSIAAWQTWNLLVDQVITDAMAFESGGFPRAFTTRWSEF